MSMSETLFVASVRGLVVNEPLGRGFQIEDGLFLSNDALQLGKLIDQDLIMAMGGLEFSTMKESCFVYMTWSYGFEVENGPAVVKYWLDGMRLFCHALWLLRDNAVNVELGFCRAENSKGESFCSTNYIAALFSRHDGSHCEQVFSLEDLKTARSYYLKHLAPIFLDKPREVAIPRPHSPAFFRGASRIARFNMFLIGARSEHQLPVRISQAMTCLEVLFSNDASELSHKLSERVAWFVGKGPEDRKEVYSLLKRAYGVRSKVVHGDALSPALIGAIETISGDIDNMLRLVFLRVVQSLETTEFFESSTQQLEDYFLNLVLGGYA